MQPRHIVERRRIARQDVGLLVVDHLQPVLDGAQQAIGVAQDALGLLADAAGADQRAQRAERPRRAQLRLPSAVDQLVDLDEELDLADAARPRLTSNPGPEALPLGIMVADAAGERLHLADRAEIERAPPHERVQRLDEIAAEPGIPGDRAGADEGGPLPGQGRGFVIADRRVDRQHDRRHLGRRPQPEVDAEHIALLGAACISSTSRWAMRSAAWAGSSRGRRGTSAGS